LCKSLLRTESLSPFPCMLRASSISMSFILSILIIFSSKYSPHQCEISSIPLYPSLIYSFFFAVALRPNAGHGLLILEFSRSHTVTHHSRRHSSGRAMSSSHRPLPDNTTLTTDKHPCSRWDSNPRSQQARGRRPTS